MKKTLLLKSFFLVLFSLLSVITFAQPYNWTIVSNSVTIEKESTMVNEGLTSAKVTWTSTSNQDIESDEFFVTEGSSFSYKLDVFDNTNAGRVRMVIVWSTGNDYSSIYSTDQAVWQTLEYTGTVPSGATTGKIKLRFYDESAGWAGNGNQATVYVDNAIFSENGSTNLIVNGGFENWPGGVDTDPPVWTTGYPKGIHVEDIQGTLVANMDEPGIAYYIVVYAGSTTPTSDQVKAGVDYDTVHVLPTGSINVLTANMDFPDTITGASPETSYDIWVVAEDATGNLQTNPVLVNVTTTAPRSLTATNPQANDVFSLGDSVSIEWTSANIDSLLIGAYSYTDDMVYIITGDDNGNPAPVDASLGLWKLRIPHDADPGQYDFILADYYDTTFRDTTGTVTLEDHRALSWVFPQDKDTFYVGDSVTLRWSATNIDSILIGGYDYTDGSDFMITADENENFIPLPATPDSLRFMIPLDANSDSVRLIIYDAEDTSFVATADPVYLADTVAPKILETTPVNGATDFPGNGTLGIEFTENVIAGTGNLYLKKSDGTLVESFDISTLTIIDAAIYLSPALPLEKGVSYYVEADPGVVKDWKDNLFTGISGSDTWSFTVTSSDLFFSEYIEGSSNNKALEIFNPTDHVISLDNYRIAQSSNGGGWAFYHTFPQGTEIAAGDVYVIITDQVDPALFDASNADEVLSYPSVVHHNGDDARGLEKTSDQGATWNLIDIIGDPDNDPGTGWDVAGVPAATANHTLLRKASITIGNTDWISSAGTDATDSEWMVFDQNFFTNLGQPTPNASNATEINSFEVSDSTGLNVTLSSTIDSAAATVDLVVVYGTNPDSLYPAIGLSAGATVLPATGDTVDITNPVVFTVTAEDGLTTKDWTVSVTVSANANTETEITSFVISNSMGDAIIENINHAVDVEMPYGTDISALTPELTLSPGATVVPGSGEVQDFTSPVTYTVTAQDGTTTADWTVTITLEVVPDVTIYDVQFTTDASGDSPYLGQKVKVSGIVTAINIYQSVFKGYFLQDSAKAWNGVYVYDPDHDATLIGDSVTIVCTVDEYYNLTELKNVEYYVTESSANTIPGPVEVATGDVGAEQWEGVFVRLVGASCIANDLGHGEVTVNDGSGDMIVDDFLYVYDPAVDFTVGNVYHLTGVINFSFGAFKLNPRSSADISDVTGIQKTNLNDQIVIYPNPGNGMLQLNFRGLVQGDVEMSVLNISGQMVYRKTYRNVRGTTLQIDLTNQAKGLYFIKLNNHTQTVVRKIVIR